MYLWLFLFIALNTAEYVYPFIAYWCKILILSPWYFSYFHCFYLITMDVINVNLSYTSLQSLAWKCPRFHLWMHVCIASDLFLGDWEKSIKEVKVCSGLSTIVVVEEEEEGEEASYITEHSFFFFFKYSSQKWSVKGSVYVFFISWHEVMVDNCHLYPPYFHPKC